MQMKDHFQAMAENCGNRSRVGRPKGGQSPHLHLYTATAVGQSRLRDDSRSEIQSVTWARKLLKNREAILQACSQPPAKPSLCFNNGVHRPTTCRRKSRRVVCPELEIHNPRNAARRAIPQAPPSPAVARVETGMPSMSERTLSATPFVLKRPPWPTSEAG